MMLTVKKSGDHVSIEEEKTWRQKRRSPCKDGGRNWITTNQELPRVAGRTITTLHFQEEARKGVFPEPQKDHGPANTFVSNIELQKPRKDKFELF